MRIYDNQFQNTRSQTSSKEVSTRSGGVLSGVMLCCVLSSLAHAQVVADADYDIRHTFTFTPGGDLVDVFGTEFRHAWIQTNGIFGDTWSVDPLGQDPLFDPFGTESFMPGPGGVPIAFNSGLGGVPVPCFYSVFTIPPSGINSAPCIILTLASSFADACNEFFVRPYSTTPPFNIEGYVSSVGGVHAIFSECYAYSAASVSARGGFQLANGTIQWGTAVHEIVDGQSGALSVVTDPVHFTATSLNTGDQIEASLLNFEINAPSAGSIDWEAGSFETDHRELDFRMEIPQTYIDPAQAGTVHLVIENGVVIVADDTGIFDGLLPPLGQGVPLSFPMRSDFALSYDLGLDPDQQWEVLADLSGAGGNRGVALCPIDFNMDGRIDFFDISLFLKFYQSQDQRADLNGDGVIDFFDISALIAGYSAGCDPTGDG